ncbi:hypothetical protein [Modestobacter sp. SYSU DS0875]
MTIAAAVCITVAGLAELAGIWLVVKEARNAQQALRRWSGPLSARDVDPVRAAFRRRDVTIAHMQQEADGEVIAHLLGSQARQRTAILLLVVGVVVGALGNFLSLSW